MPYNVEEMQAFTYDFGNMPCLYDRHIHLKRPVMGSSNATLIRQYVNSHCHSNSVKPYWWVFKPIPIR